MDANKKLLNSFLSQKQQLSIPIYQRKYSWGDRELKQLWDDLIITGKNTHIQTHFIGNIVYMNLQAAIPTPISELLIIDGQQRITTISILIAALTSFLKENDMGLDYRGLLEFYLINDREKGEKKYKLILTGKDKDAYFKIIDSLITGDELKFDGKDSKKIINAYKFFKNAINKDNYNLIYQGFLKFIIIEIGLERGLDNPQLIFESLNSTGLELNKSDLIRNYILMDMDVEEQNHIYETYWLKLENEFFYYPDNLFDEFIRDYLTIKCGKIPTFKNIYHDFKVYALQFDNKEDLVKDIYKYASYFFNFVFLKEEHPILKEAFENWNELNYGVTRNFILRVYEDYDNNIIDVDTFIEIIELVESYVTRRNICEIPTNSLNKTFATLYNEIDKDNYLNSLKVALVAKDSYRRFPDYKEFRSSLLTRNIYSLNIRNYFLRKLENHDSKEKVVIDNLTIEHIMPQNPNLSLEWQEMIGENWEEIQDKYLHTLGNITLTGYNSELSDRPFNVKRDVEYGFASSPLTLNSYLGTLGKWDEEEILKRGKMLSKRACEIWKYPKVSKKAIEEYVENKE